MAGSSLNFNRSSPGTKAIHAVFSPALDVLEGGDCRVKEASMKRFWLAAAAALILTTMLPDGSFAQRGGFRGGGFGGGGFRGAAKGGA